ncbi:CLUMA_CG002631, isoform A [Clunio marinus]|uniref:CLUMA_CG002631, isoform A n=1 Tax=Clunio marinus TaxID=568069 RepID=A0A1J1HLF2_9DIPT|nr:CLUMA_CG002631, isoform A [Clunio marinus]
MQVFIPRFQATGDHLPVAPPAPPQPIPQPVQPQYAPTGAQRNYVDPYDKSGQFDDGSYDERWNNPSFQGDGRSAPVHRPAAPAPSHNYNYQHQAPAPAPAPIPAVRQQNYNVPQAPQHYETTQNPHRFLPPGKLSLNRTPDGFSYTFNKA